MLCFASLLNHCLFLASRQAILVQERKERDSFFWTERQIETKERNDKRKCKCWKGEGVVSRKIEDKLVDLVDGREVSAANDKIKAFIDNW
jgi:hypothetical protein